MQINLEESSAIRYCDHAATITSAAFERDNLSIGVSEMICNRLFKPWKASLTQISFEECSTTR